jgi:hypothetical protein
VRNFAAPLPAALLQCTAVHAIKGALGDARLKQFYAFLESFIIVVLVVAGLVGLFHSALRAGGWFDAAFDYLAPIVFTNVTASVIIGGIAIVGFAWWHDRHVAKGVYNKRVPTIVLFVLMAAGVYYVGRYAILGTL